MTVNGIHHDAMDVLLGRLKVDSPDDVALTSRAPPSEGIGVKGIDAELAKLLESNPFILDAEIVSVGGVVKERPPPYPRATSRTQLKQQLQRQQTVEQERRERPQQVRTPLLTSPETPLISVGSVPVRVLRVETRLENPTLYHVMESQKRQVRRFLQENCAVGPSPAPSALPGPPGPPGNVPVAFNHPGPPEVTFFCNISLFAILFHEISISNIEKY